MSSFRLLSVVGSGYGDLSTTATCADEEVAARTDSSQSCAIVAARQLHADWQLNAMNGIGVVRNWQGIWKGTSYVTYAGLTLRSDLTSRYRESDWHPQVAVVWRVMAAALVKVIEDQHGFARSH